MVIYLIEKDDTQYPLYAFKFYYTDIALNRLFSNFIYTDIEYLLFEMSCEINQIKNKEFYLKSENDNKGYLIKCEDNSYITENVYKCILSEDNENKNPLLKFGSKITDYGYYKIVYTNKNYTIHQNPFFSFT